MSSFRTTPLKSLFVFSALLYCSLAAVSMAQTPPGEPATDFALPEAVVDPANPPQLLRHDWQTNQIWPVLRSDVVDGCNYDLLSLFPIDYSQLSSTSTLDPAFIDPSMATNWIARFTDPLIQFPGLLNPSVCLHDFNLQDLTAQSPGASPPDKQWVGMKQNIDPFFGPETPTLPPLSTGFGSNTLPLVPAGPDAAYRPMLAMAERQTAGGVLDLATGSPLIRAVDMELEFGGAVFRHVRTYANSLAVSVDSFAHSVPGETGGFVWRDLPGTRLWDWHGLGWMTGHNPLFLFDAALPDLTELETAPGTNHHRRRCYFILDAHHAIPFDQYVDPDGEGWKVRYEAPARSGAQMQVVGGVWDNFMHNGMGGWEEYPHAFYVWVNDGALRYTIIPIYEDIRRSAPTVGAVTDHDRAQYNLGNGGGAGIPYLGLTVDIQDRYGNRIINEYCGFHQWDCSLHSYTPASSEVIDPDGSVTEPGTWPATQRPAASFYSAARTCCQSCHRKGQLHRTYLVASGETEPSWTIVYSHRTFLRHERDAALNPDQMRYPYANEAAIQTIRAYRGALAHSQDCLTVDFRAFHSDSGLTSFRGFIDSSAHPTVTFGDDWDWSTLGGKQFKPGDPAYNGDAKLTFMLDRLALSRDIQHPSLAVAPYGTDWDHEVQYVYSDASAVFDENREVFPASFRPSPTTSTSSASSVWPRLIAAIGRERTDDGGTRTTGHAYRYTLRNFNRTAHGAAPRHDPGVLRATFEPNEVSAIFQAIQRHDQEFENIEELVLALAIDDLDRILPMSGGNASLQYDGGGPDTIRLRDAATHYFAEWYLDDDEDYTDAAGLQEEQFFVLPGIRRVVEPTTMYPGDVRSFGNLLSIVSTGPDSPLHDMMTSNFVGEMVGQLGVTSPDQRLIMLAGDTGIFATRQLGRQKTYKVYRFLHLPENETLQSKGHLGTGWPCRVDMVATSPTEHLMLNRAIWHFPNRVMRPANPFQPEFQSAPKMAEASNLRNPLWYAVIDEYPDQYRALVEVTDRRIDSGFRLLPRLDDPVSASEALLKPDARTIVALNAMGYVVWSRTFEVSADGLRLDGAIGHRQEHVYDDKGRVLMVKSYGWSAAERVSEQLGDKTFGNENGLVTVYDYNYDIASLQDCAEPRRIGVQWGDRGDAVVSAETRWLVEYSRDEERPDVVLAEIRFESPPLGQAYFLDPAGGTLKAGSPSNPRNLTQHVTTFYDSLHAAGAGVRIPWAATVDKSVRTKLSIQSKEQAEPGGPELAAVTGEAFDPSGNLVFAVHGLAQNPSSLGSGSSDVLHVDWSVYDDEGRVQLSIQDIAPNDGAIYTNELTDEDFTVDFTTFGWVPKMPSGVAPLGYKTSYKYGQHGLIATQYPNGKTKEIKYKPRYESLERVTFFGIRDATGAYHPSFTEFTRSVEHGFAVGRLEVLVTPDGTWVRPEDAHLMDAEVVVDPEYDPSGRPSAINVEADGETLTVETAFNQFGTIDRARTVNGTITRKVYDELGRLIRTYRGSNDWTVHFGAPPDALGDDDMMLIETKWYGEGLHDAMQPVQVRSYRDQPANPYSPDQGAIETVAPLTMTGYDWRMRPVVTIGMTSGSMDGSVSDPAPNPLVVTVAHLDEMDRPRFQAVYDGSILAGLDPKLENYMDSVMAALPTGASFSSTGSLPSAADFDHSTLKRLTETTYTARGNTESVREYDLIAAGLAGSYVETRSYFDHEGRAVRMASPGESVVEAGYDGAGREVIREQFAGSTIVSRVKTTYNADGHPIEIETFDRLDNATDPYLPDSEAVRTKVYHWYHGDDLVCTAELGTWDVVSDEYLAGQTTWPAYDPLVPPVAYLRMGNPTASPGFGPCDPAFADALVTAYGYDDKGNRAYTRHPDGTVTRQVYDALGQVVLVQEGITLDPTTGHLEPAERTTYYRYAQGKLVEVWALLPGIPEAVDTSTEIEPSSSFTTWIGSGYYQRTEFRYGAEVVVWNDGNASFDAVSLNNEWIGSIHFPDANGDPATDADLEFQYYPDGLLASRKDARGVIFNHFYDDLDRRIRTEVSYPDETAPFDGGDVKPADRVELVEFEYDHATGRLMKATASSHDGSEFQVVAQSVFTYDDNQRLTAEAQQRGDEVDVGTPKVEYDWLVQHHDAGNQIRLTGMQYPERLQANVGNGRLVLDFIYGQSASIDDLLGRITTIRAGVNTATHDLASFVYTGSGMRVRRAVHDTSGVARAIEGFAAGDAGSTTVYEHLDRFGRLKDLHWRDAAGTTQYRAEHTIDAMDNRAHATISRRNSGQGVVSDSWSWDYGFDSLQRLIQADADEHDGMSGRTSLATHAWSLDPLGNWSGDGTAAGLHVTDGATGLRDDSITHAVGRFNLIESRTIDDGTTPVTTGFVYDRMGNLVYDGVYWYRYDAWSRLIQIVEAPSGGFSFDGAGVKDPGGPAFADVVAVFAYDALGRLVGRQAPFPGTTDEWRTETYFHDGSRRITERWKDPLIGNNGGGNTGNQQNQQTSYVEDTEREYVYTPGYVDEFVAEYDLGGAHWAVLQDANYNAVSLVESSTGNVARQRVLSPYGRVLQSDAFIGSSPLTRVGHQGLFAERVDANTLQNPQAASGTIAWHNRNRTLLSEHGRFAQRDPNGSGQGVGSSSTMAGVASSAPETSLDGSSMFADGASLYAYAGASPVMHTDPGGLFIGGILGMFAPTTGMDIYSDYNDSAIDAGLSMTDSINDLLNGYGMDQLLSIDLIMDWDTPDSAIGTASLAAVAVIRKPGHDIHHIVPRFLLGLDDPDNNYLQLPKSEHKAYHKILREEFKTQGLNPPNARGSKRWRYRLLIDDPSHPDAVSDTEKSKIHRAMKSSGKRFDASTSGRYSLYDKIVRELDSPLRNSHIRVPKRRPR